MLKSNRYCGVQIQKRINSVIEARRKAGEKLPPPPKTAIAGPEFFGFNQPEVCLSSNAAAVCSSLFTCVL